MHCLQEMWKKRLENPEYYREKEGTTVSHEPPLDSSRWVWTQQGGNPGASSLRISCYFIFVCELMNALAKIKLVRKFWFFALLLLCFLPSPQEN